ncbi:uncharacterized protein LOC115631675 isoform X2 [Scaptodrosophila lebanonensis]|uniref:Uncharacterized protein LOC115631675 isoform X2 n=1 Tax=Drosophila lebanonensis TaxID=7225 RepID=A0A6J2UA63_DROLE|nr:uncharacterized protein LOC115631675 isoform X2 [Scaptodrosophila lebanonensis]
MSGQRDLYFTLKEVLPVFRDHFLQNFNYADVKDQLHIILSKRVIDTIATFNEKKQIYCFLFILNDLPDQKLALFVNDILKIYHEFLMDAINHECRYPHQNTTEYIQQLDKLFNGNQRFSKYNVPRLKKYLELEKALLKLRPAKNVVIEGVLGAGKQWLALHVCSSYAVQSKMDFKIFWVNVREGTMPEKHLELLQSLLHQLDNQQSHISEISSSLSIMQRIDNVKAELRRKLMSKPYKNCLLVLRNVQTIDTWKTFNLGCKILLTTRSRTVCDYLSPSTTVHIVLPDVLTLFEVESLFCKYMKCEPQDLPNEQLTSMNTLNPRTLSIIAETIRDGLATWENWKHVKSNKLVTIIENSLQVLDSDTRKLFNLLLIFPPSANIPINLLKEIWSVIDPSIESAMDIVVKLQKYSLVELQDNHETVLLPNIYLELPLQVPNESTYHCKIVKYYNIRSVFNQCNDTTLSSLDCYFYSHIGHHLSKLLNHTERVELFRMVFLDFRFLDVKIRQDTTPWHASGSILNTLQQLKFYRNYIIDSEQRYLRLLNALLDFLPKVEEKLIGCRYTCLLRVALMAEDGAVYEEACRQVQRFPNHVWFTEHGSFHQHRQVINLGKHKSRHANYLDEHFCLMALDNNNLLLTDVSLEAGTTYVLCDENDQSGIKELRVFNKQQYLLTLHENGNLKLWSLWPDTGGRPLLRRRSSGSRQRVHPQWVHVPKDAPKRSHKPVQQDVSAFFLDELAHGEESNIQLHVAYIDGNISIFNWKHADQEFKRSSTPMLRTKQLKIRCFAYILSKCYVVSAGNGVLSVWNLKNSSREELCLNNYNPEKDPARQMDIYLEQLVGGQYWTTLLLICEINMWRIRIENNICVCLDNLNLELLYRRDAGACNITCAKLSLDGHYLILGTKSEGLIVYDLKLSEPVLRSNVSEHVTCVDIYKLSEDFYKYIVLCGAEGKNILYLHILCENDFNNKSQTALKWVHNVDDAFAQQAERACLEPNVYLRPLMCMAGTQLFAVDSKQRIHQIQTEIGKHANRRPSCSYWSTITPTHASNQRKVTAICASDNELIYAGYDNGIIMDVNNDAELKQEFITESIDYLKQLNSNILIASAGCKTIIFRWSEERRRSVTGIDASDAAVVPKLRNSAADPVTALLKSKTMYACIFEKYYLILFCQFGVYYVNLAQEEDIHYISIIEMAITGFDLQSSRLFVASEENDIQIFQLSVGVDRIHQKELCSEKIKPQHRNQIICYLIASNDGTIFALGYRSGEIELYSYDSNHIKLVYRVTEHVHEQRIRQLRFSPCKQVLISSCAEKLCFWSVTHMRNNQLEAKTPQRSSGRFGTRHHVQECEEVDAMPYAACRQSGLSSQKSVAAQKATPEPHQQWREQAQAEVAELAVAATANLWREKRGNASIPELLACIKFVGNKENQFFANKNFTQFFAIDDAGVYYHLRLLQSAHEISLESHHQREPIRQVDDLDYENIADRRLLASVDHQNEDVSGRFIKWVRCNVRFMSIQA